MLCSMYLKLHFTHENSGLVPPWRDVAYKFFHKWNVRSIMFCIQYSQNDKHIYGEIIGRGCGFEAQPLCSSVSFLMHSNFFLVQKVMMEAGGNQIPYYRPDRSLFGQVWLRSDAKRYNVGILPSVIYAPKMHYSFLVLLFNFFKSLSIHVETWKNPKKERE